MKQQINKELFDILVEQVKAYETKPVVLILPKGMIEYASEYFGEGVEIKERKIKNE